jgi:hypothetical protein
MKHIGVKRNGMVVSLFCGNLRPNSKIARDDVINIHRADEWESWVKGEKCSICNAELDYRLGQPYNQ